MPPPEKIINCHVHTFTGDHVPNFLAKGVLMWPLYYLVHIGFILRILKRVKSLTNKWRHSPKAGRRKLLWAKVRVSTAYKILQVLVFVFGITWVLADRLDEVWLQDLALPEWAEPVRGLFIWLKFNTLKIWPLLVLAFLISPLLRLQIVRAYSMVAYNWLKVDSSKTIQFLKRYWQIITYTLYGVGDNFKNDVSGQNTVFKRLKFQYPPGTRFVVLPMDMRFMGAGRVQHSYRKQMDDLLAIRTSDDGKRRTNHDLLLPFVFVDPRRIRKEAKFEEPYFEWEWDDASGRIQLTDRCYLKKVFDRGCVGIKIYPALGYYPFDKDLLPLWLWCAQEGIPITSHCVMGSIHSRARITKDMRDHPLLRENSNLYRDLYEEEDEDVAQMIDENWKDRPLYLREHKQSEFQVHWTHPLNYLMLLEPDLLAHAVDKTADSRVHALFGLEKNAEGKLSVQRNLRELKVNLAHFGGADEWLRFLNKERGNHHHRMEWGKSDFFSLKRDNRQRALERSQPGDSIRSEPLLPWGWLTDVYQHADWFTLITGLMRGFPNVYADISHTLYDERIITLLDSSLDRFPKIRERTLFGSDFYVVRNYDSDKKLLTDWRSHLGPEKFSQIAEKNPVGFMKSSFYDPEEF